MCKVDLRRESLGAKGRNYENVMQVNFNFPHRNNVIKEDYAPGHGPDIQIFIELTTKPNPRSHNGIPIISTLRSF